jgi:hypothetical protein
MSADVSAAPPASPLLFNWQPPRPRKLSIVLFIVGSIILHGICFYLFQIVYAPAVVLLPPPARVSLITADTEEGRNLLRWVDAEDPALASATQRPPDARQRPLPKVQHIPSYVAEGPKLKHAPPLFIDTRAPSVHPPGPVPAPRREAPPRLPPVATRIQFSDELAAIGEPHPPQAHFTASNQETPQAIRFRVAVGSAGVVRYCFPLNSSGDPDLDEQARAYLALTRFDVHQSRVAAGDNADSWGIAIVNWGNDIARPSPPGQKTPP